MQCTCIVSDKWFPFFAPPLHVTLSGTIIAARRREVSCSCMHLSVLANSVVVERGDDLHAGFRATVVDSIGGPQCFFSRQRLCSLVFLLCSFVFPITLRTPTCDSAVNFLDRLSSASCLLPHRAETINRRAESAGQGGVAHARNQECVRRSAVLCDIDTTDRKLSEVRMANWKLDDQA